MVTPADNSPPKGRPKPPNAGKGRVAGVPNKITTALKDAVLVAFDKVGGAEYLERIARTDPKTFCVLLGRLIPTQLNATHDLRTGLAEMLQKARERARSDS